MQENRRSGWLKLTRQEWIFSGFLLFFCALFTFIELNNHRLWMNDLRVYYEASRDFFAGNNPYVHNYGLDTGNFKYPPFTLYLFSPFSLFSYGAAQCIHLSLLAFSLIASVLMIRKMAAQRIYAGTKQLPAGLLYLLFACVAIQVSRELHLGNVNLVLLLLFTVGMRALLKGKEMSLAICWSLMIILKPIMILAVIPLLINGKWKAAGMIALLGGVFFLFPALHVGWTGNLTLWHDWFTALGAHVEYLTSFNAIGTLVLIFTGFKAGWIVALACLGLLVGLMLRDRIRYGASDKLFFTWSAVFLAFIPNFFTTDTEHFLLSLPLLYCLLTVLRQAGRWYHWTAFFAGMLCFSFHSNDLLGTDLSHFMYDNGFLGIGNLVFIALFLVMRQPLGLKTTPPGSKTSNTAMNEDVLASGKA